MSLQEIALGDFILEASLECFGSFFDFTLQSENQSMDSIDWFKSNGAGTLQRS